MLCFSHQEWCNIPHCVAKNTACREIWWVLRLRSMRILPMTWYLHNPCLRYLMSPFRKFWMHVSRKLPISSSPSRLLCVELHFIEQQDSSITAPPKSFNWFWYYLNVLIRASGPQNDAKNFIRALWCLWRPSFTRRCTLIGTFWSKAVWSQL